MDWMQFTAELAKSLGWPIAAGWIAYLFRRDMTSLLKRVVKGKIGVAEFEFEKSMEGLAAAVPALVAEAEVVDKTPNLDAKPGGEQLAKTTEEATIPNSDKTVHRPSIPPTAEAYKYAIRAAKMMKRAREHVGSDPRRAIMEAWKQVENSINDLGVRYGLLPTGLRPTSSLAWEIITKAIDLSPGLTDMIDELRHQGFEARHSPSFAPNLEAVETYLELAMLAIKILESSNPSSAVSAAN